jgi:hypothetical protein
MKTEAGSSAPATTTPEPTTKSALSAIVLGIASRPATCPSSWILLMP